MEKGERKRIKKTRKGKQRKNQEEGKGEEKKEGRVTPRFKKI